MSAAPPPSPIEPGQTAPAPTPPPAPEPYPFWNGIDAIVMFAMAIPAFLAAAFVVTSVFLLAPHGGANQAMQAIGVQFGFWGIWLLVLRQWLRARYQQPFWRSLGWVSGGQRFGPSAALGLLTAVAVIALTQLLPPPPKEPPLMELLRDPAALLVAGVMAVSLGPVCEELAFRGFLQPLLVRWFGPVPGILLTAMPFAVLHGMQYGWMWQYIVVVLLAGGAFGWVRHRTGSTVNAAVMHAAYNLVFFAVMVVQRWE